MRIRWTLAAANDLENIWEFLRDHYPHFAERAVRKIDDEVRLLASRRALAASVAKKAHGSS